ncbi:class I SAM-dependent DNA methyltransferase [Paeniglutamicibacter kerguelensis]|uniref:Ubiquinone/menaquinone biosynthesis C-methylase UbiE n=1 Tax=Paeniglutamicibacter kerguelensis TaxID=254788 RepID=A0ABS4XF30_9MICC|nr:class I SAM-dependent methyltransferase [Paeniglutamicibacter kerguelensis]MBP2387072.1 ubiquinone/menaquinone biosynthesis C-methylase UbiE [Paeniglutamicibacter kerguelensis]
MEMIDWKAETQAAYDLVAPGYERLLRTELDANPFDRALLGLFAELVGTDGSPVADLGCGTGRIARYLSERGLDVRGMDLSPKMIEIARRENPGLSFDVGSLEDLDMADESCAGVLAWYSIIHAPMEVLPQIFAEMHRVLRPGGFALLAFQSGNESVKVSRAYGHEVSFTAHRLDPEYIASLLEAAGFARHSSTVRQPGPMESTPQAYLMMRKEAQQHADD